MILIPILKIENDHNIEDVISEDHMCRCPNSQLPLWCHTHIKLHFYLFIIYFEPFVKVGGPKKKIGMNPISMDDQTLKRSLFLDPSYYTNNLIINVLPFPHAMLWQSCFFRNINLMRYIICSDFHKTKEKIIITIELPKWFEKKNSDIYN